jgi:transcriptional regulator with PAS, ATPase and Fis domain
MARARSGTSDLTRTFADCPQPIYLLNSRRVIVYANPACANWLGIEVERLVGARCDYHSLALENQAQTIAAGLCPPPEAFAAPHYAGVVTALHETKVQERPCHYLALSLPDETSPALLALVGAADQPRSVANPTAEEPSSAELHVLLRWLRQTLHARPVLDRWVGDSPAVRRAREQFAAAAASRAAVVVVGPRGAGRKELARGIHYRRRTDALAPLVTIDCAVVDAEALQTSITSLVRKRSSTDVPCGALLLLEVDQLSPAAQRELLGFLTLPGFDVRTLATATRSPLELAGQGGFDRALAFALSTLVIELPPLASRLADLPLLVQMLVEELNAAGGKQVSGVASDALERLAVYTWPGDVAQLAETIKQAWTSAAGPQITLGDLPRWLSAAEDNAARPHRAAQAIVLDDFLADVERELLARALARGRGNKSKAARLLGISRPRLLRRMEQLGLSPSPPEAAADG